MSVINTNIKALVAQDSIMKNNRTLSTAMERLSTGSRINSAKDDAAGLAISTRMDAQVRGLSMAIRNANDGISLLQTAEGGIDETTAILQRMRELAVQSVNGTNNVSDRKAMNDEVQQLKTEIDRIASTSEFNSQKILDGSFKDKVLQIGDKSFQTMELSVESVATKDLGMSSGSFSQNTLVGTRLGTLADFAEGAFKINGQDLGTFTASSLTGGLQGLLDNINQNVDNVSASAFNTVVAKNIGTGITTAGQFKITVGTLGKGAADTTTYSITASSSLQELVDNINREAGAQVQASLNSDKKLVLSNNTGATISVFDASVNSATSFESASGFRAGDGTTAHAATTPGAAVAFSGFLKLDSKDGSPVRIERGTGSTDGLAVLGFRENTSEHSVSTDAYTVTGKSLTLTGVTTAWGQTDLKINGVSIHQENIATTTFQGKLDAINNFSAETEVIAYAAFDTTVTISAAELAAFTATNTIAFNGHTVYTGVTTNTVAGIAASINTAATVAKTGITAEVEGDVIRLRGANVQSVLIDQKNASGTAVVQITGFTSAQIFGAIRLDSVRNQPISIELGDDATVAEHGLLEQNVGASDFMVNKAELGVAFGGSLTGLEVSTQSGASKAISTIDRALETVNGIRSKLGAMENRLTNTVNNLSNMVTNTSASRSRIQDTDYAKETTTLAKAQIIQQAATAMLAQANQQPQSVLALLQ